MLYRDMELLKRIYASDTSAHVPGCARCMADVVSGQQVFVLPCGGEGVVREHA